MGWNDWPYWLKGGVIFLAFDVALLIFLSVVMSGNPFQGDNAIFTSITQPILSWFTSLSDSNPFLQSILVMLQGLLGYFIIGAAVGWIYGKIKEKA